MEDMMIPHFSGIATYDNCNSLAGLYKVTPGAFI